jgi:hypothetical protein
MQNESTMEGTTMYPAESHCKYCEKFVLELESHKEFDMLLELPNTFDPVTKQHEWRDTGLFAYALIPRSFHGTIGRIDVYVCVDEDDLDDVEISQETEKFLKQEILPSWGNFKTIRLAGPSLSPPADIGCWRIKHTHGETADK